ncbi:U6 snRNA-associated protein, putative [Theileria equi strain WA]|uniref:U6 snRNA-associated Sm-like protein LSm4 n=1 Tax=Theileria equi strain WA TaxID=1537102 RepID=L1LBI0_THEEQ|nr:U6 snRNA-associated protein, putative [Theileria equi strain WA]EKX72629.1 U6 snRNA-associated protein, putative [Theileria equi strain WA]|eukprot:XP_004832081.1 U6 snRNA-associated protein, putative [Theileria equi strain WA]
MVLPLTLLRAGKNQPTLIELKNGETYSGILESCDAFMNIHMLNVVCTSKSGTDFWKLNECYIRGNNVKSLRLPNEVAELAKEESKPAAKPNAVAYSGRGRGKVLGDPRVTR